MRFTLCLTAALILTTLFGERVIAQDGETVTVITHKPPPPTAMQQVDNAFKHAVEVMEAVLFYRLATTERQYIVYERGEQYVRKHQTGANSAPFRRLGAGSDDELTPADVELLAAKNRLVPGDVIDGEQRLYRLGQLSEADSTLVDYVTVKIPHEDPAIPYGSKYVQDDSTGGWRRVTAKRGLLSDSDVLSEEQIKSLGEGGWLQTSATPTEKSKPYIHTEKDPKSGIPVVVAWLSCGAVFFTLYMGFFNIWGFRHAIDVVRGKYDNPDDEGEVSHFQALASALSATIGLGNIAGVTIAMTLGGPGAFFWMLLCGLFGMTSKFVECTLGQKYRHVKPDGTILGGPMRYLSAGLKEMNLGLFGSFLSIVFAVMCILASFGGGNMFQANQSGGAVVQMFQGADIQRLSNLNTQIATAAENDDTALMQSLQTERRELSDRLTRSENIIKPMFGIVLACLVAVVIIGGIKRIGAAAGKVVPTMCLMYVAACLWIIGTHIAEVPALVSMIFADCFSGQAMGGGLLGVLVVGVQRAAFSNEAGVGSAAIAHSAAKTDEPIREGCVALLGPFIDTIVVCSMTALVILITGAWDNNEWVVDQGLAGAALTSKAFESEISWFPYILSIAIVLFAYSTIISWSYYGEKAWESLFGPRSTPLYKLLAVIAVFVGTIVNLGSVLDFSDMMILGMAFPNIAGVIFLAPQVKRDLAAYWTRYKAGEFRTFK
ncbi:MAG: alanine:cation symporter family protein [Planctomycetaceae bacterium]|nr:alanine:cation symporter family protein [Planctomycetaceae bacterium]